MNALGGSVTVVDETTAFRYFDARDLLGFVDGTANPVGPELTEAALIGDEDPDFAGGSYVVVQKYLHDLTTWASYGADQQSEIIGRDKADNIEHPDAATGQKAHKTLATLEVGGVERAILRDNMPFGRAGSGEFGTYFIGYAGNVTVTLTMLRRMFLGDPLGHVRPHPRRLHRDDGHPLLRPVRGAARGSRRRLTPPARTRGTFPELVEGPSAV